MMAAGGVVSAITASRYELLTLSSATNNDQPVPRRAALILDEPNHLSFLSEGVNDAMIQFLSPLLPVAQTLQIPVLDFDRYKESRDSKATAELYHPVVVRYLKQEMM